MKTIKKVTSGLIAIVGISFLLMSCEGNTNREWVVKNNSSTTIKVEAVKVIDGSKVSKSINSGSSELIIISEQRGGSDRIEPPTEAFSSMVITNATNDTLKKDYKLSSNWKATVDQTKKRPSHYQHEYVLDITNQDF